MSFIIFLVVLAAVASSFVSTNLSLFLCLAIVPDIKKALKPDMTQQIK